jgi:hypothetical protein
VSVYFAVPLSGVWTSVPGSPDWATFVHAVVDIVFATTASSLVHRVTPAGWEIVRLGSFMLSAITNRWPGVVEAGTAVHVLHGRTSCRTGSAVPVTTVFRDGFRRRTIASACVHACWSDDAPTKRGQLRGAA